MASGSTTLRYGLVGTGHWATTAHASALVASETAQLTAVWGRRPDRASVVAEGFGATAFTDPDEMFDAVDAVAFAVPPDVQAELATRAAGRGCHLLLDKPVALDVGAADQLVEAVASAGVASRIFFTFRFHPVVSRWLADAVGDGGWLGAQATWFAAPFATDSPYRHSTWRRERGALWDVGPHALSLLLPALGQVAEVTAVGRTDGRVHAALVHDGGAISSLDVSFVEPAAAARWDLDLHGEHGWTSMPPVVEPAPAALTCAITELSEAASGRPDVGPACDVAFGREVVDVLARIEAGLATG